MLVEIGLSPAITLQSACVDKMRNFVILKNKQVKGLSGFVMMPTILRSLAEYLSKQNSLTLTNFNCSRCRPCTSRLHPLFSKT